MVLKVINWELFSYLPMRHVMCAQENCVLGQTDQASPLYTVRNWVQLVVQTSVNIALTMRWIVHSLNTMDFTI